MKLCAGGTIRFPVYKNLSRKVRFKMFKSKAGFTLVELIVVITILAILAGVAVPAYSGYITKVNETADITALAAVKTAVMATYAKEGTVTAINLTEPGTVKATAKGAEKTVDITTVTGDFCVYYGGVLNLASVYQA